jgi:hypothetical protein
MLEAYTTTPIPNDKLARMICQRSLANLRALSARISVLSSIAESANAPRITELAVNQTVHEPVAGVVPLLAADCFARLRRLHVSCSASMLSALMRPGLALIVTTRPRSLLDWIAELVARQAPLEEMRLVRDSHRMFERRGMELVLHHAGGAWNHLEVRWSYEDDAKWRDELIASLRRLPAGAVQRLSFVGPSAARFDTVRFKQRVTGVIPTAVVE